RLGARADVVLLLGKRLDYRVGFGRAYGADAKLIQVDVSPAVIGANRPVSLGIVGDVAAVLEQLTESAGRRPWRELPWLEELRRSREQQRAEHEALAGDDVGPGTGTNRQGRKGRRADGEDEARPTQDAR